MVLVAYKNERKGEEPLGFTGLSSLVSNVDMPPPSAEVLDAERPPSTSAQEKQPSQTQPHQTPARSSSRLPRDILLVLGAVATFVVLGLIYSPKKTVVPPVSAYPPVEHTPSDTADKPITASAGVPAAPIAPLKVYAYVITKKANLRAAAHHKAKILSEVDEMSQVEIIEKSGLWTKVKVFQSPSVEGFIASRLLREGSRVDAKKIVCDVAGSTRPYSGEVLLQASQGGHQISVSAGDSDAFVKMRSGGRTVLAFYVRSHEKGVVSTVPNGNYEIMFASGHDFSRKCLEFVSNMSVIKDPNLIAFQIKSDGYYKYFQTADYSLVNQRSGNMRPQTVDADSFRE